MPYHFTKENAREMRLKGVEKQKKRLAEMKASGEIREVRAKNRKMKELCMQMLKLPLEKGRFYDVDEVKNIAQVHGVNTDAETAIVTAMIHNAINGDVKSAEFLRDTSGQKPSDKVDVKGEISYEDYVKNRKVKL